ncbi:MAG: hypothetical protein GY729_09410, partial [Desulfobacteraceae bacterium]|nr:hypothetical protein [Desulfobacteraceae bacterium]
MYLKRSICVFILTTFFVGPSILAEGASILPSGSKHPCWSIGLIATPFDVSYAASRFSMRAYQHTDLEFVYIRNHFFNTWGIGLSQEVAKNRKNREKYQNFKTDQLYQWLYGLNKVQNQALANQLFGDRSKFKTMCRNGEMADILQKGENKQKERQINIEDTFFAYDRSFKRVVDIAAHHNDMPDGFISKVSVIPNDKTMSLEGIEKAKDLMAL